MSYFPLHQNVIKIIILTIFLGFAACSNPYSPNDTFQATVYLQYPTSKPYNMFQVIESKDFDKTEINIHYGEYLQANPDKKPIIENDTIRVEIEEYTSRFGSIRYRLLRVH